MKKTAGVILKVQTSGFTLVELIIAIMIIVILASIGYAKYTDLRNYAYIAQCQANQQHLITAQKIFWLHSFIDDQEGHYAENIEDLVPYMRDGAIPQCPENGTYQIVDENKIICTIADHAIQ
ncbi:prepilin-type N-terminal cleavage/methylation domain-containing protein [bacterium]|nr:prepilin-type N-terminal cleavage/methylation domain-containing protein [bacterium]